MNKIFHQKPMLGELCNLGIPGRRGLVYEMWFNEGAGGTVYDKSGNGRTAALGPGVTRQSGHLHFGNTSGVPTGKIWSAVMNEITVVARVRIDTNAVATDYFADESNSTTSFGLRKESNADVRWFCYDNSSHDGAVVAVGVLTAGVWYQVVGTRKLITNTLYIDGVFKGSTDVSDAIIKASASAAQIGTDYVGGNTLTGDIDYFFIYDRPLSASEIQELYISPEQYLGYDVENDSNRLGAFIAPSVTTILPQITQAYMRVSA